MAILEMMEGVQRMCFCNWVQYCISLRQIRARHDAVSIAIMKALEGDRRGSLHVCFISWTKGLRELRSRKQRLREFNEFAVLSIFAYWKDFCNAAKSSKLVSCVQKLYAENTSLKEDCKANAEQLSKISATLQSEIITKEELTEQ